MKNESYSLYENKECNENKLFFTLKELVYRQARERPGQIAFSYIAEKRFFFQKTFGVFQNDLNALGTFFTEQGYRNKKIAIIGENSYEWMLAFMAVVNSGNTAVPVDGELSAAEMEDLLQDIDCRIVIYSKKCAKKVEQVKSEIDRLPITDFFTYFRIGKIAMNNGNRDFLDGGLDMKAPAVIYYAPKTENGRKSYVLSQEELCYQIWNFGRGSKVDGITFTAIPYHSPYGLTAGMLFPYACGEMIFINQNPNWILSEMRRVKPKKFILEPTVMEGLYHKIQEKLRQSGDEKRLLRLVKVSNLLLRAGIDLRGRFFAPICQVFGGQLENIVCYGDLSLECMKAFSNWGFTVKAQQDEFKEKYS